MAGRRKNGGIMGPRQLTTTVWSSGDSTGVWDLSAQYLLKRASIWPVPPIYEFRMVGGGGGAGSGYLGNYYGRGGGAGYTIFVTTFAGPWYVIVGKGGSVGSGATGGAAGTLNQGGGAKGGNVQQPYYGSGAGGGFSGVFSSSTINQGNALAMAGGGGGGSGDGSSYKSGGYGGGTSGGDAPSGGSYGKGGTASAGGAREGAALAGGAANENTVYGTGGGGGGYYGGGGGQNNGEAGGGGSGLLLTSMTGYVSGSMVNGVGADSGNYQNSGAQVSSDSNFGNYGRGSNAVASGTDGRVMWRTSADGGVSWGSFTQLSMTGAVQTVTP